LTDFQVNLIQKLNSCGLAKWYLHNVSAVESSSLNQAQKNYVYFA
jgi:hypothetical protein